MIVTLTGVNDFERSAALHQLVREFLDEHGEFAIERFDGEEASAATMRAAVESLPFLTPKKMVILREPSRQKQFSDAITEVMTAVADTVEVIIVEPKLDKRLSYYKTLKKDTDFREYADLDASGLAKWVVQYATKHQATISLPDARLLIDRIGPHQQMLRSELDKLLGASKQITAGLIDQLTDRLPQSTIFELLDAAFAGKTAAAMALYDEQRALKVEPQAIMAMLAWQLHILTTVKAAGDRSSDIIARTAKLNPFVVRKSQALTKRVTMSRLRQLIAELLVLDKRLKSESINADDAVQVYLLKISA